MLAEDNHVAPALSAAMPVSWSAEVPADLHTAAAQPPTARRSTRAVHTLAQSEGEQSPEAAQLHLVNVNSQVLTQSLGRLSFVTLEPLVMSSAAMDDNL
jgi:hypothetical protein